MSINDIAIFYYVFVRWIDNFSKVCLPDNVEIRQIKVKKYAKPYCNIGVLKEEEGKISEAIEYYEKAIAIDSTLEQAKTNKKNADAKLRKIRAVS